MSQYAWSYARDTEGARGADPGETGAGRRRGAAAPARAAHLALARCRCRPQPCTRLAGAPPPAARPSSATRAPSAGRRRAAATRGRRRRSPRPPPGADVSARPPGSPGGPGCRSRRRRPHFAQAGAAPPQRHSARLCLEHWARQPGRSTCPPRPRCPPAAVERPRRYSNSAYGAPGGGAAGAAKPAASPYWQAGSAARALNSSSPLRASIKAYQQAARDASPAARQGGRPARAPCRLLPRPWPTHRAHSPPPWRPAAPS
jgi:hypothetical protein